MANPQDPAEGPSRAQGNHQHPSPDNYGRAFGYCHRPEHDFCSGRFTYGFIASLISGIAMIFTDWYWLDPVVSLIFVAVVIMSTWGLLRDSAQLALSAVPAH